MPKNSRKSTPQKVKAANRDAARAARQAAQAKATPAYTITDNMRAQVRLMASAGIPQRDIARVVVPGGMHVETLEKHFREELDTAAIKANSNIAGALYNGAMAGGVAQQIFWLKTRAGWKETQVTEVTGKDGGPIQTEDTTERPTDTLRQKIEAMVRAFATAAPPAQPVDNGDAA